MPIAWTLVALLGAATFSTIGLLATALFQVRGEINGLRGEMHAGFTELRSEIRALGDRPTAAGA